MPLVYLGVSLTSGPHLSPQKGSFSNFKPANIYSFSGGKFYLVLTEFYKFLFTSVYLKKASQI